MWSNLEALHRRHQRVKNICEFFAVCAALKRNILPIFMPRTLKNEEHFDQKK
jgi:hypothetical protein